MNIREYNTSGNHVLNEDWDTLIILDACRYDLFEEVSELPGTLTNRTSRGSNTYEFLKGNFAGRDLTDTVYVASHAMYHWHREELSARFHAVENVWDRTDDGELVDPKLTTEVAQEVVERYPNKRHIIHYLQPHYPFLGAETEFDVSTEDEPNFWDQQMRGTLDLNVDRIWGMYRENLRLVLPFVEEFMESVPGLTIVTSDHGNYLGERCFPIPIKEWGHPDGLYTDILVRVPWLKYQNGPRREIEAEDPILESVSDDDSEEVSKRLRMLGYRDN